DPGWIDPRQAREVDGGLGLADSLEHTAAARAEREDVPRLHEVVRRRLRPDRHLNRVTAVGGGDAGRYTLARLDRDGERRSERRLVVVGHRAQLQLVGT